jgi:hypothetical protein
MRSLILVGIFGLIGLPLPERLPAGTWTTRVVGSESRCGSLYLQIHEARAHLLVLDATGRETLLSLPLVADGSVTSTFFWRRLRSVVTITIAPGVGARATGVSIDASQCQFYTPIR